MALSGKVKVRASNYVATYVPFVVAFRGLGWGLEEESSLRVQKHKEGGG